MTLIATSEPAQLTAGDRWRWSRADLAAAWPPGDGWALRYALRPEAGGAVVELAADAAFAVDVTPATTAAIAAGRYAMAGLVEADGDRATVFSGVLTVAPDPAVSTADGRSHARRVLDAINATIAGRASKDAESYTIEGRTLTRTPIADLLRLRAVYRAEVRRESGGAATRTTRQALR